MTVCFESFERRPEDRVGVVVDGMPVGVYDPLRSDALLRVQGDHDAENSDFTAVQERKAYVGEAARYLPQAVVDKDIPPKDIRIRCPSPRPRTPACCS